MSDHAAKTPIPRPNVELVQQLYEAFRQRDLAKVFSLFAADVEILQSDEVPWGGTYRGHDGAAQFFAKLTGAITSTVAFERFVDAGDQVVAIGRTRGTVNANGNAFDVPVAHLWVLRDGKVAQVRFCIDNPTMRAALPAS